MLSICRHLRVDIRIAGSENFSGNDNLFTRDFEIFKDLTEPSLWLSTTIYFCCVEMVDAILKTGSNDLFVLFIVVWLIVDGSANRDYR